ncbi:hypothetical protein [Haliangium sp.]|uniref:hypothetical protein n=1 Tax=Haliangium sp. TaxID=2663208 RepID=UPI003D0F7C0A
MTRNLASSSSVATVVLLLSACSTAHADRVPPAASSLGSPLTTAAESPYSVDIIDESGFPQRLHQHRGRTYVLGQAGSRYIIRVGNPTPRRIEVVLSVDGLDVVDGEPADLRKRGYVVQPHSELRLEGFRVSAEQVAAFRFSSVSNSYAGRKGKARNVGVIGVAIFEEEAPSQLALTPLPPPRRRLDRRGGFDGASADLEDERAEEAQAPAPRTRRPAASAPADAKKAAGAEAGAWRDQDPSGDSWTGGRCCRPRPQERPGLGTAFGERRSSPATWTRFVRATPGRPNSMLELRYNDAAGLQALGISLVDDNELITRESASPFPGDRRFSIPPQ